jgi:hypothetical protein
LLVTFVTVETLVSVITVLTMWLLPFRHFVVGARFPALVLLYQVLLCK